LVSSTTGKITSNYCTLLRIYPLCFAILPFMHRLIEGLENPIFPQSANESRYTFSPVLMQIHTTLMGLYHTFAPNFFMACCMFSDLVHRSKFSDELFSLFQSLWFTNFLLSSETKNDIATSLCTK